jgi:hypothetical protein
MNLYDKIIALYPSLTNEDFLPKTGVITLQNNSDGKGDYIKSWSHPNFSQPTEQQLAEIK